MKLITRIATLIAAAVLSCSAFTFSACDLVELISGPVQVDDTEWRERFSVDYDIYDNYTVTVSQTPLYDTDEAEENGGWKSSDLIYKVDRENSVIEDSIKLKEYYPSVKDLSMQFADRFFFCKNDSYYSWVEKLSEYTKIEDYDYIIREHDKDSFEQNFLIANDLLKRFETYASEMTGSKITLAQSYGSFTFNKETKTYEWTGNYREKPFILGIKFNKSRGITLISEYSSIRTEYSFGRFNTTTVFIPQEAYDDLNAYLENGWGTEDKTKYTKLNETEWQEKWNINLDNCDSFTAILEPVDQAGDMKTVYKVDQKNKLLDYSVNSKSNYALYYDNKYFSWTDNSISEITAEDFKAFYLPITEIFKVCKELFATTEAYELLNFNEDTNTYEYETEHDSIRETLKVEFTRTGGIKILTHVVVRRDPSPHQQDPSEIEILYDIYITIEYYNGTVVTVPQNVYNDLNAYLDKK